MTQAHLWATMSGIAFLVAGYAWYAERKQKNRRDLDDVSLIPWTLVLLCALIVAIITGYYAAKLAGAPPIRMRRSAELQVQPAYPQNAVSAPEERRRTAGA